MKQDSSRDIEHGRGSATEALAESRTSLSECRTDPELKFYGRAMSSAIVVLATRGLRSGGSGRSRTGSASSGGGASRRRPWRRRRRRGRPKPSRGPDPQPLSLL